MSKWWNWVLILALICLLFVAIPIAVPKPKKQLLMKPVFDDYIKKYNKTYGNNPEEYEKRFEHFMQAAEEIDKLNAESRGPELHRAQYGFTQLSDMSKAEYREIHLSDEQFKKSPDTYGRSWKHREHSHRNKDSGDSERDVYTVVRKKRALFPLKFDWRTEGVIGPVRDQGLCGACWAFSTVGVMEAMNAMKTGKMTPLSVQEAIDCARLGNSGCSGGDICLLLDWLLMTDTPIQYDKDYPLKLIDGVCSVNKNTTGVRVSSFTCDDFVSSEDKILEAIALHGPVSVAVNGLTWQNYLGGVIQYHCSGAVADLNHAVLLVGYDLTTEVPYYIAKNSWGVDFGLNGYIKLAVGTNVCGLANEVATIDVK